MGAVRGLPTGNSPKRSSIKVTRWLQWRTGQDAALPPLVNSTLKHVFFILLPAFFSRPTPFCSPQLRVAFPLQTTDTDVFLVGSRHVFFPEKLLFSPQGPLLPQPVGGPNRGPFWRGSHHIGSHSLGLKKVNALAACF